MDTGIVAALIGTAGGILITIVGMLGANKAGIGKTQEKLVSSLKDLVDIQNKKITQLETTAAENTRRIVDLSNQVEELKGLTVSQATELNQLRRRRMFRPTGEDK